MIEKLLNEKTVKNSLLAASILSAAIIVSLLSVLLLNGHFIFGGDVDKSILGIVGDFIGGIIGTIFTIVATILVWLTYSSQKKELELTRKLLESQNRVNFLPNFHIHDKNIFLISDIIDGEQKQDNSYKLINIGSGHAKNFTLISYIDFISLLSFMNKILDTFLDRTNFKIDTSETLKGILKIEFNDELYTFKNQSQKTVSIFTDLLKVNQEIESKFDQCYFKFLSQLYNSVEACNKELLLHELKSLDCFRIHSHFENSLGETLTQDIRAKILQIEDFNMLLCFRDYGSKIVDKD
jgi:hypothetical protein